MRQSWATEKELWWRRTCFWSSRRSTKGWVSYRPTCRWTIFSSTQKSFVQSWTRGLPISLWMTHGILGISQSWCCFQPRGRSRRWSTTTNSRSNPCFFLMMWISLSSSVTIILMTFHRATTCCKSTLLPLKLLSRRNATLIQNYGESRTARFKPSMNSTWACIQIFPTEEQIPCIFLLIEFGTHSVNSLNFLN